MAPNEDAIPHDREPDADEADVDEYDGVDDYDDVDEYGGVEAYEDGEESYAEEVYEGDAYDDEAYDDERRGGDEFVEGDAAGGAWEEEGADDPPYDREDPDEAGWDETYIALLVVIGALLVLLPEPVTSGIGAIVLGLGLVGFLIEWLA